MRRVSQVYLFQLATQRTQWLSARQSLIANNVANANTPNFKATDMQPFASVLDTAKISMATTDPGHMSPSAIDYSPSRPEESDAANATLSGNSVNLEDEMIKLGDVSRDYSAATGIKKTFHQMMMAALK
jgi:flagellar basal-body rod protein FlgB